MKIIATAALFLAATFVTASSAPAQDDLVKAAVPFNFTVGDRTLPSGTYTIGSRGASTNVLVLRNWDKKIAVMSLGAADENNPQGENVLVFHRYGNQYFLSDIRSTGTSMNIHFAPTKAEKRAKAEYEEARLPVNDPVLIALN
jgi:hypothetical protein